MTVNEHIAHLLFDYEIITTEESIALKTLWTKEHGRKVLKKDVEFASTAILSLRWWLLTKTQQNALRTLYFDLKRNNL